MKRAYSLGVAALVLAISLLTTAAPAAQSVRLVIMSGSHGYQTNQFLQMFRDNHEVTFESVVHPNALVKLRPENATNFDVLVMYDYAQKISPEAQADYLDFLKAGKGVVILHHAIAAYPQWPEYEKILGGRYYLQPKTLVNGVEKLRSRAKEGAHIAVKVADASHPVTRGLQDFEIDDETYFGYDVAPDSHVLLSTTNTNNAPTLAWSRSYQGARIVYIQLGHDHLAYENPNYRKLVAQAIRWVAKRD